VLQRLIFFTLLAACLVLAAGVSERYSWDLDLSARRINSLSPSADRALDALAGRLELTALIPDYPVQRAQMEHLLAPYLAHPSGPRLGFVDPVREPDRARQLGATRHGELQLRSGTRKEVIAVPNVQAIDMALNRLALEGERWIVSLKGHGEDALDDTPAGLGRLVAQVEGLGYRFIAIDPRHVDRLPDNTAILLIAGPQRDYGGHTRALIEGYLEAGGPVLWLLGDAMPSLVRDGLGVGVLPGTVVDAAAARHGLDSPDNAIVNEYPAELLPHPPQGHSVLQGSRGLVFEQGDDWQLVARLQSSPLSWNETAGISGELKRNPELGEQAGPLSVGLALQRMQAGRQQRAVVLGNHHSISNDQIGQAGNMALAVGLLRWLGSDAQLGGAPVARDLDIDWPPELAGMLGAGFMGLLPIAYLALGLWSRARRRRA